MTSDKRPLDELINEMIKEQNHNPRDCSFRLITRRYPEESHKAFNFPGKYANAIKTGVHTEDGRNLHMDCAQLIMPDDEITCKSTINVEHQSTPLNKNKIDAIYDYKLELIHKNKLPSNSIIITHIDPGKKRIITKSHDQIFYNHYIVIDENEISKRLKTLKNIIENNKKPSKEESLNFAVIAIFVHGEKKKEIMEKLTHHFTEIESKIDENLKMTLHEILKKMIKKHFEDDIEKTKELLKMISENIYETNYDGLTYKELLKKEQEEIMAQKDQQIEQKDQQIEQLKQKDQQHKQEIKQLKQQIAKQNRIN